MKVQEVMERLNMTETGKAVAYIKDGLEEIEMYTKENVLSGSKTSITANTISFGLGTTVITNGTEWTSASGGTEPSGWNQYESYPPDPSDMQYTIDSGRLKMATSGTLNTGISQGIYQEITLVEGAKYKLSIDFTYYDMLLFLSIGESAPSITNISSEMFLDTDNATFTLDSTGTYTADFTATATTGYITIYTQGPEGSGDYSFIDNLSITPYQIEDSANGLGNFTAGIKMRVNGSSSNDTDESDNTSTGYYTPKTVAAGVIVIDNALTTESAGNTISLIGTNQNYMDIIANKRYYPLPSDMLSLISVKAKNHQNNEDKYREIPRMIYKPLEQDADDI